MTRKEAAVTLLFCEGNFSKKEYEAFNMAIRELEKTWIPVSERVPDEKEASYLVWTDGGDIHQCRWTNVNHFWTNLTTDWHWHIMDVPQYSKVVAWMPLPEPYKEEEDE